MLQAGQYLQDAAIGRTCCYKYGRYLSCYSHFVLNMQNHSEVERSVSLRYGVALLAVVLSMVLKLLLEPLIGRDTPFLLAFAAITLSAWYGGHGPGLLATGLAAVVTSYLFLTPTHTFLGLEKNLRLAVFVLEGVLVSWIAEAMRVAERRASTSSQQVHSQTETLRQSEENFRLLVESVQDYGIFMLDTQGHISSWNAGAQRIKGYSAGEIIGQHLSRFYTAEDVARRHPQHELEIATAEGRYEEEGWRVRKDGSHFWANVVITALRDETGQLRGFAKVTRDITERKEAEENIHRLNVELERKVIERTAELEAANRELEAFSYSVSHDLRAPLRSIDGFSQALLEDYADQMDDQGRSDLQRVRAATQRMAQLIDDLLNLSRITRSEMRRQTVDLSALARSTAAQLQGAQPERQVEFHIADGVVAHGDERLLQIVLENLLGNAWKFTGKQPHATIEFNVMTHDGKPAYFVRDDGAGFDMAYAGKLFGAFQRLHGATEFEGTGIGLATVQRIVRRHGGRIWAESQVGRGATFYFTLSP